MSPVFPRFLTVAVLGLAAASTYAQDGGKVPTAWDGVFTAAQAARGQLGYSQHCASCHGADLRGGEGKALAGDRFWADWKETTVDYLLGQISRNMPRSEDGSLAGTLPQAVYADIVAHILEANGFPPGARELTTQASTGVAIVARSGPGELPADAAAHVVGCLAKDGDGWKLVRAARPARLLSGRVPDASRALGDREIALKFVVTRLDKYVGQRMSATGRLIGEGGSGGLNVDTIAPAEGSCE
jgi:mono/diheme cytochrome c family protein